MQKLPDKIDSKFRFVLLSAHRAEQMMRGAVPKDGDPGKVKNTRVAMNEVLDDKIHWDYGAPEKPAEDLLMMADEMPEDMDAPPAEDE